MTPTPENVNDARTGQASNYSDEIISKLPDARLQRVVRARILGKRYWEIAEVEHCSVERARQLWHLAQRFMAILARSPEEVTRETRLADLVVSVRLYNICVWAGIVTLGDLANYSLRDLLCIRYCGRKTVREAIELLNRAGLRLKSPEDDGGYWVRQTKKLYEQLEKSR